MSGADLTPGAAAASALTQAEATGTELTAGSGAAAPPTKRDAAPAALPRDLPGPWAQVLGEPAAVQVLRTALSAGEVAHAWLLVGPRGVGQQELVRAFAAALNCERPPTADVGCGTCSTCRRIARGRHPSVETFIPEGAFHLVEQVREDWIPTASRSLSEGRRRVLHITAADRMNEAAQNAFLKMLEEPPPSAVWVLDAEDIGALLDTILSRCRTLTLVPWGMEPLRRRAQELGVEDVDMVARAALGSPARLADLADPDVAAARQRHLGIIDRLATGGPGEVVPIAKDLIAWSKSRVKPLTEVHAAELEEWAEAYGAAQDPRAWPPGVKQRLTKRHQRLERQEQRRMLDLVLDDLASYLRDLLVVQAGNEAAQLVNIDSEEALSRDAPRLPAPAVVQGLAKIAACREALDRNGAPDLQFERLLLALALPIYAAAA